MALQIVPVSDARALDTFIRVPWTVYRDDAHWVPPLLLERKEALSKKNPFFEHAQWQGFTALMDGRPVGRISAQIDSLHQERYQDATGYFGLFESPDDKQIASALFAAAESWLLDRGMRATVGPLNLGINQEVGLLVEGFDQPPNIMMGHAPRYYGPLVEACGYEKAVDVLAYEIGRKEDRIVEAMEPFVRRLPENLVVRPLDTSRKAAELDALRDIFNDAWSGNWGFVPFTENEFRAVGNEMLMLLPRDFIQIAEIDGEPVAFITLLPNINEALADLDGRLLPFGWLKLLWRLKVKFPTSGRVALMGVRKHLQRTRLGPGLAYAVIREVRKAALAHGLTRVEFSWILEQNKPTRHIIELIGGTINKRYRLYRKNLGATVV
ncbi:MAG: N-acetyltransferase [Gammaproteobacteria bacterium]|nr:N-acetyltransferase [Gammaproteobacteria bacterium]